MYLLTTSGTLINKKDESLSVSFEFNYVFFADDMEKAKDKALSLLEDDYLLNEIAEFYNYDADAISIEKLEICDPKGNEKVILEV